MAEEEGGGVSHLNVRPGTLGVVGDPVWCVQALDQVVVTLALWNSEYDSPLG